MTWVHRHRPLTVLLTVQGLLCALRLWRAVAWPWPLVLAPVLALAAVLTVVAVTLVAALLILDSRR